MKKSDSVGFNIDKPAVSVRHSSLIKQGESFYRVACPVCKEGILLVHRDHDSFELMPVDHCVSCGQLVIYLDIDEMRKREESK